MFEMICEDHPKYKGIRSPRARCLTCLKIYEASLEKQVAELDTEISILKKELKWWEENWDEKA